MTGFGMNLDAAQASVESAPSTAPASPVDVEPARPAPPTQGRATIVDDLRALADFLEQRPELAAAVYGDIRANIFPITRQELADVTARIGAAEKVDSGTQIGLDKTFGSRVRLQVRSNKELTCERVQVGTRTVKRAVYPADIEPTIETVEEPVFEWKCPPSFLALEGSHDRLV